jgi:hypothetical protein
MTAVYGGPISAPAEAKVGIADEWTSLAFIFFLESDAKSLVKLRKLEV